MIRSILDTDLYKLTQQLAVLELFPRATATYEFIDRGNFTYSDAFFDLLDKRLDKLCSLSIQRDELEYLEKQCDWIKPWYLAYLADYQFKRSQVAIVNDQGKPRIKVGGPWHSAILWEVPLMSLISECYFETVDTDWDNSKQEARLTTKREMLSSNRVNFYEFGTRRRRNFESQLDAVRILSQCKEFKGTSNVYLAMKHNLKPVGTQGHEWYSAHAVLMGIERANRFAMLNWNRVYNGLLSICLPDTFTTEAFLRDFDTNMARLHDGARFDSGDMGANMVKFARHYEQCGINPETKRYVPSNSLDVNLAIALKETHRKEIGGEGYAAAIGTWFTNDFDKKSVHKRSEPLNIVVKLTSINGKPTVKLSDDPSKACGNPEAVRVAKYILLGEPLDKREEKVPDKTPDVRLQSHGQVSRVEKTENNVRVCHTYMDGLLHRVGGPAVETSDGLQEWYLNGIRHRDDGPAYISKTGVQKWFREGVLHRDDGPAIIWADGTSEYFRHGEKIAPPAKVESPEAVVTP